MSSFLLRSTDGGLHWQEVMLRVPGSEVIQLTFIGEGEGWALVEWMSEGTGSAILYHTTNYGESWEELAKVPFFGGHSATVDVRFLTSQHGQIREVDGTTDRGCGILESMDGLSLIHISEPTRPY